MKVVHFTRLEMEYTNNYGTIDISGTTMNNSQIVNFNKYTNRGEFINNNNIYNFWGSYIDNYGYLRNDSNCIITNKSIFNIHERNNNNEGVVDNFGTLVNNYEMNVSGDLINRVFNLAEDSGTIINNSYFNIESGGTVRK